MWLHDQLRPEEERNRYPRPKSDADFVRPSPFVPMSTLDEVLDDVGALKRESVMDLVAMHALLHTPPPVTMDGWFDAPAADRRALPATALALTPPIPLEEALGSTSSPRGPGVQRGDEPIRGRRSRRVRERREAAGSSSPPSPIGEGGTCAVAADGRPQDIHTCIQHM